VQLLDPTYAATAFYSHLTAVPGWSMLPMAEAAQRVQASADGSRYAEWARFGTAVANALYDGTEGSLLCTQPAAYEVPPAASPAAGASHTSTGPPVLTASTAPG